MKRITLGLTALFLSITLLASLSPDVHAQGKTKKAVAKTSSKQAATEVNYKAHCGMIYSAAEAKKYHYICPMDHKPLVKIVVAKIAPHPKK
jgi:hypothetical protein